MQYIPNTVSLVSFVLISFQNVSSLLHSPALMRHNAENVSFIFLLIALAGIVITLVPLILKDL